MEIKTPLWPDPVSHLAQTAPDRPVFYFAPEALHRTARRFLAGFPGLVTYAVKANDSRPVLRELARTGLDAFDVASPDEMAQVRAVCPGCDLHYHNPVRSRDEIAVGRDFGVTSWSVDRMRELDKLGDLPKGTEIAVRLRLPVAGAAYDFGAKFGADPELATALLSAVAARGWVPSMTFHPGTQCTDPAAWVRYIAATAQIAQAAGVRLFRLNVGGGFPAAVDELAPFFAAIAGAVNDAFGTKAPDLVCEPGRAMVAGSTALALRVKAAEDGVLTLNDGLYGALAEWRDMGHVGRIAVYGPGGVPRRADLRNWQVFGPTCDSLDRLPAPLSLPADTAEGDHLLVSDMGAYAGALATRFNGYGADRMVSVAQLASGQSVAAY